MILPFLQILGDINLIRLQILLVLKIPHSPFQKWSQDKNLLGKKLTMLKVFFWIMFWYSLLLNPEQKVSSFSWTWTLSSLRFVAFWIAGQLPFLSLFEPFGPADIGCVRKNRSVRHHILVLMDLSALSLRFLSSDAKSWAMFAYYSSSEPVSHGFLGTVTRQLCVYLAMRREAVRFEYF